MQVANNNLFKRLKKRKMKDSILNSITWIVSSFGFIVLITLFIFIFAKGSKTLSFDLLFSNYSKTIIINIGKKDGVEENMTVIGNEGLVGHVISVTDTTAKVQTIIDTASSVSCSMSTTKDSIVCKGTLDEKSSLKAMYIPTDANIIQGDSIETSGLGGIYPKGIHIGTVKKVTNTQNMTDRYALVETAVDFDKLDTVLVITNK